MDNSRLDQLLNFYAKDDSDPFIIFAIAKEYERQENLPKALEYYTMLKRDHADYVGTYFHLAQLYADLEDTENALEVYNTGIQIAEKQGDIHALSELKNAKLNFELENGL
ncbi:MAG: tetratricopeptide repeat protein [Saprospiraceae bacterium]